MAAVVSSEVTIRTATPADGAICGQICYDAFSAINSAHNFPLDFPSPKHAIGLMTSMFGAPGIYCVVAESQGRILGSNALDERSSIAGIGPITIDPALQNHGAGRKLMHAVMDRAEAEGKAGMRLVQAAFHNRSLALYTGLGFDLREPLSCLQGRTVQRSVPGCNVRPATSADLPQCNAVARQVHGFERALELAQGIEQGTAIVVERGGRITGYSTFLGFFGHTTTETNIDLQALIASVDSLAGPGILLPSRNSLVLRWCLANGLRIVQPMTLMTQGLYNEPAGAWTPSVLY
ncbi:MAG TPA: GNAT family N-acetyltransferase [Terracidiphilus sp.]|jgi:ribosomal protein S18 acetylase RimI-like enzyme|nr:GNAT family N-acetyltransferase [Terracidiphilus sp.]